MKSDTTMKNEAVNLCVVIGLAFNEADGAAVDQAARVVKRVPKSELHLVHVFDAEPSEAQARELVDRLRLYANEKAASLGGLKGATVGIHLRAGKAASEIAQLATDVAADLIVIGTHNGPSVKSWIVGSLAEHLIAASPCPVFVASPKPQTAADGLAAATTIEPACTDCLRARATSHGATWWCERHAGHAARAHTFSYQRELPFATHDSEVIPTGIKM